MWLYLSSHGTGNTVGKINCKLLRKKKSYLRRIDERRTLINPKASCSIITAYTKNKIKYNKNKPDSNKQNKEGGEMKVRA